MEIRKLDLNHPRIAERVKNFLSDYGLRSLTEESGILSVCLIRMTIL